MIPRYYNLDSLVKPGKALIIYGPRRVGKTTQLNGYLEGTELRHKLDSGDNIRVQQVLSSQDFKSILEYIEGYDIIALDEAQQIPNIGMALKIIVDQSPETRVIATGSSSFDLARNVGEPLTGRKTTVELYPIAQLELLRQYNRHELKERLEDYLIFGSYPDTINAPTRAGKIEYINELVNSYLLRDILALDKIKAPQALFDLLKLLAFQIGSEVSIGELAGKLSVDSKTVSRYLDLLEKSFVIIRLGGFSRNLRSEVTRKSKYYFLDNGVRNGVLQQFNGLDLRDDIGALWENFIVMERLKYRSYHQIHANTYFWRTYGQQEIDLIEERDGKLYGYECKWSSSKTPRAPQEWVTAYPGSSFEVINQDNYLDFVAPPTK